MKINKIVYLTVLIVVSLFVLVNFVNNKLGIHVGLNYYPPSKFMKMVQGTADRPFVYRTLLPTTIRLVSSVTPYRYRQAFTDMVEKNDWLKGRFEKFLWGTAAAYEYFVAFILMLLCFMGFAHYAAKFIIFTCNISEKRNTRLLIAVYLLLGLPSFFRYTSFLYDPPQLLLFTMALYFLAASKFRAFIFTFVICCFNKETAVLLIPVFALIGYKKFSPAKHYWGLLAGIIFSFFGVKSLLTYVFRFNPGTIVELHLTHNMNYLIQGWTFPDALVLLILSLLIFMYWDEKSVFLKLSFLCIGPPLLVFSLFIGFFEEWRVYYEIYPIVCGLIVDSLLRIRAVLYQNSDGIRKKKSIDKAG